MGQNDGEIFTRLREIGEGVVLRQEDEPLLAEFVGKELITSDGRTLLGADDKAGVAEIMEASWRQSSSASRRSFRGLSGASSTSSGEAHREIHRRRD